MRHSSVHISPALKIPLSEFKFQTSRSSGPGGQNVNKLETRVEVFFDIAGSPSIPNRLRVRLLHSLSSHLDSSGILRVVAQESRSQWKNKQRALEKLSLLIKSALIVRKKRIATKVTKSAHEKRIRTKKTRSEIKKMRGKVTPD